ncbi:MAG: hypothetical protein ABI959_12110 [Candidatus Dormiibacterota bacterium]
MSEQRLEAGDAALELAEIERRQTGVIDAVLIPRWYWWAVGLLVVPIGVTVDSHQRIATAVVAVLMALVIAGLSVWMVSGSYPGARIQPATLGSAGALYIVGFVWLVVGVSLVVAFGLQAAGVAYPATIGTVLAAVMLIVGGPMLMTRLRRTMVARSVGAR